VKEEFKGISHVAFATRDIEETIAFWRDLVGLRMVLSLGKDGYKMYFFAVSPRQYVGFFEWPGIEPVEEKEAGYPLEGKRAFDHFAIGVNSDDDLWSIRDRVDAAGFWVSEVIDHGFIHSIYTFDPNGIALEFCADNPDVDLSATPCLADETPRRVAAQGPDPQPDRWPAPASETPQADKRLYPGFGDFLGKK